MRDLLEYILKGILGDKKFSVDEKDENGMINFTVSTEDPNDIAIIIGKGGRVINSIRSILKIKASIEKKFVNLNVAA